MKQFAYLITVFVCVSLWYSCNDDFENYSNNPQDLLSFSTDTLRFDTVLATVNSPFNGFKVYNQNSKPLLVSEVYIAKGEQSVFKINVDGVAGQHFGDVEIRSKDSIYVFIDIKPDLSGSTEPLPIRDSVIFICNGFRQFVVLEAFGQDVKVVKGLILNSYYATLDNRLPYLVYDSLVVAEGCTAEIPKGTVFYMNNNAKIIVHGTINVRGTVDNPVIFRGSRTDSLPLVDPVGYDKVPGQWGGIVFTSNSYNNIIANARIRNTRSGILCEPAETKKSKLILRNTVLTNSSGDLFTSSNCRISAENTEFSTAKGSLLSINGGDYEFLHCTFANFYPYAPEAGWLHSEREILTLSSDSFPLVRADFYNSILVSPNKTSAFTFVENPEDFFPPWTFINCLFAAEGENDDSFIDCNFGAVIDSVFVKSVPEDDFGFDFSLKENSPARDMANTALSGRLQSDINGKSRFADGKPDAGAYEFELKIEN